MPRAFFLVFSFVLAVTSLFAEGGFADIEKVASLAHILQANNTTYEDFVPDKSTLVLRIWAPDENSYQGHVSLQSAKEYLSVWNEYPGVYAPVVFKSLKDEPEIEKPDLIKFFVGTPAQIALVNKRIRQLRAKVDIYSVGSLKFAIDSNGTTHRGGVNNDSKRMFEDLVKKQATITMSDFFWAMVSYASRDLSVALEYTPPTGSEANCCSAVCEVLGITKALEVKRTKTIKCRMSGSFRWNFTDIDLTLEMSHKAKELLANVLPYANVGRGWEAGVKYSDAGQKATIKTNPGEYVATMQCLNNILASGRIPKDEQAALLMNFFDSHDYIPINLFSDICPEDFICVHSISNLTDNRWRDIVCRGTMDDSLPGVKMSRHEPRALFDSLNEVEIKELLFSLIQKELKENLASEGALRHLDATSKALSLRIQVAYLLSSLELRSFKDEYRKFATAVSSLLQSQKDGEAFDKNHIIGAPFLQTSKQISLRKIAAAVAGLNPSKIALLDKGLRQAFTSYHEEAEMLMQRELTRFADVNRFVNDRCESSHPSWMQASKQEETVNADFNWQ